MQQLRTINLPRIFAAFLRLGGTSFGGGTAGWLYRDVVQRRRWVDDRDFLAMLGIAQILPGSNGVNLTALIGQHLAGAAGTVVGLGGLLAVPFVVVLAISAVYGGIGENHLVQQMLDGVAAAVIGLTFATGLRTFRQSSPGATAIAIAAATVLCVGVLRWPLLPVIAALAPLSIGLAWREIRRRRDA